MEKVYWNNCDSRSDMEQRLSKVEGRVFNLLEEDESNTWGYLSFGEEGNVHIPIGFHNVGLFPEAKVLRNIVLVGISKTLAGVNLHGGEMIFKYKMPTVFREFVLFCEEDFIAQDETGFVRLSHSGEERWVKLCDDIVEEYTVTDGYIRGKTMEGDEFSFSL